MSRRHTCIQNQGRRSYELEEDERWHDGRKTVICRNDGDRDSLLYGDTDLDDRDRCEGFALSAERVAEQPDQPEWAVLVDDYDSFKQLRDQEQLLASAGEWCERCRQQAREVEGHLERLREEARDMKKKFGSIDPRIVGRGQRLSERLADLVERERHYSQLVDSATETIRRLEAAKAPDPDAVASEEATYNTVHWNLVYQWGQALIDRLGWLLPKMGNSEIARLIASIQGKRNRKEVTFEHYVHLMGLLNGELHKRTGGANFLARRNKMADLWVRHRLAARKNTDTSVDAAEVPFDPTERQFGETRLSESELVEAIDIRRVAGRISSRHRVSFEEAVAMLTEEQN